MANRPILPQDPVIINGSMGGNITSKATILNQLTIASYGYSWAGTTPIGAMSIEVSNDYSLFPNGQVNNPGTWNVLPIFYNGTMVTSIPITGNSGNGLLEGASAAWAIRTVYTRTSGTGTLQAIYTGKVM